MNLLIIFISFFTSMLFLDVESINGESNIAPVQNPDKTPPAKNGEPNFRREIEVTTLAYRSGEHKAEGIGHITTIGVRHKKKPGLKVGFFLENVDGIGPQWRASGWSAVTLASLLLGVNPENFEFTFDTGIPYIDGPSAGGLTTIGVLAGLLGDTVREDSAMTGTINPDGTIGPVGGIPQKIEGAHSLGRKLVLVPAGQRYDYDANLKRDVDLVEVGRKLGMEVRLVANIFDAYEILTGKILLRPQVSGPTALPPRAFDKFRSSTMSWLSQYQRARNRFNQLSDEAKRDREPQYGDNQAKLAEQALAEGMAAVAEQRAWEAAYDVETSLQAALLDEIYMESGLEGMLEELQTGFSSGTEIQSVLQRLKAAKPRSASETIALMDAWSAFSVAWGYNVRGNEQVQKILAQLKKKDDDKNRVKDETLVDWVYQAAMDYVSATTYLVSVRHSLDAGFGFGESPAPSDERVKIMADLLRRAAAANLALFERTIIDDQADKAGVSVAHAKNWFMEQDEDYQWAVLSSNGQYWLEKEVWEEPARSMMMLGSSLTTWASAAICITKYYSVGAQINEDGVTTDISKDSAMANMLDLSAARAKELIALVHEEQPISAIYYMENARIMRQGQAESQLTALMYNWMATVEAQMLAYFTGDYGKHVRTGLENSGRSGELLKIWDLPSR